MRLTLRGLLMASALITMTVNAQETTQEDGRQILEQVEDNMRAVSDAAFNRIQLSSCRFGLQNSQITCAERPRIKALESVSINTGADNRDTQSISIVLEPAAERGIGMLSYSYDDADRDNETWLYLSALGQVKRIASGNSDDDSESASLFGSEFTTEDQDTGKLEEYEINILESGTESGREVWVIETIPNAERARKTRYARTVQYIDKERFVVLRADMYDRQGREIKRLMASRIEQVNGVWTARSLTMMNLVANRLSNMAILEINTGIDVPENFLTPRTLTDVAFREAELSRIRAQVD
ncbi:outer membrane lipoprotein-sorting protein [Pseudohongiella acticola]|jgi:Outer membrane lipoprotein-sorting protein|uniref:Outer membrane lipoprotein-sorting protein n=1 Tax=Pseudohongiella acticola TaxID=1524254 RepID=A0A1E8CJD1_9GAMM|nr:outer membrane lipoprotein-sorting protein [Pseudohongiella acticola]OFE12524.1 outer membrane lipoprotein-sorting protein [Pseudohongiella acticola]